MSRSPADNRVERCDYPQMYTETRQGEAPKEEANNSPGAGLPDEAPSEDETMTDLVASRVDEEENDPHSDFPQRYIETQHEEATTKRAKSQAHSLAFRMLLHPKARTRVFSQLAKYRKRGTTPLTCPGQKGK